MTSSCIILGSSRSGKSTLSSLLPSAVFGFGDHVHHLDPSDRVGYLEDRRIGQINGRLIEDSVYGGSVLARALREAAKRVGLFRTELSWLRAYPSPVNCGVIPKRRQEMARIASKRPFAYNDPRFCYSLAAWKEFLEPCTYICMFRDPVCTRNDVMSYVHHMVDGHEKQWSHQVDAHWYASYRNVLDSLWKDDERWFFVHFADLFTAEGHSALGQILGVELETHHIGDFPDPPQRTLSGALGETFERLLRAREITWRNFGFNIPLPITKV